MDLNTIGSAIGAGLASAGIVTVAARRWISQRAEKKIDALSVEIGVGTVGPSLLSLVATTAKAVDRLETNSEKSEKGAADILIILTRHGESLEDHSKRLGIIENRHDMCGFTNERVAEVLALKTEQVAETLAAKTKDVAAKLAAKTEDVAEKLAHHPPNGGPKS
jgi:hypothetical protein